MTKMNFWRKTFGVLLGIAFLVGVLPVSANAAQESAPEQDTIYTSLIYSAPSGASRVAGRMEDGTKLRILGQQGGYYKIDCYDTQGYIAAPQVSRTPEGEYYISCEPDSQDTVQMKTSTVAEALRLREGILELAKAQLGDPYVYGATGPHAFDCSGFTSYLYRNNGYAPARICSGQMAQGVIVSREGLQVGDLILFGASFNDVQHIGIYAGQGQIIHAGSRGIVYAPLDGAWFTENYLCARRIITVGDRISQEAGSLLTWRDTAVIRTA